MEELWNRGTRASPPQHQQHMNKPIVRPLVDDIVHQAG